MISILLPGLAPGDDNIAVEVRTISGEVLLDFIRAPLVRAGAAVPSLQRAMIYASLCPMGPVAEPRRDTRDDEKRVRNFKNVTDDVVDLIRHWTGKRNSLAASGKHKGAAEIDAYALPALRELLEAIGKCLPLNRTGVPALGFTWEEAAFGLLRVWADAAKSGGCNRYLSLSKGGPSMSFIMSAMRFLGWANGVSPTEDAILQFLKRNRDQLDK